MTSNPAGVSAHFAAHGLCMPCHLCGTPLEAAKYLQKEFRSLVSMDYVQHVFNKVTSPPHQKGKLWLPTFWAGVLGICPGSGSGKDGLLCAFTGLEHLYKPGLGQADADDSVSCRRETSTF